MDERGTDTPRTLAGRYELIEPIGRGGMGIVWRARDTLLDREAAVKEVYVPSALPEAERDELYRRTLREARSAARLRHPNVVTLFDVVEEDERPWIVMELVHAGSLEDLVRNQGLLPPERAAHIGRQVLAALIAAHAGGVLHRDVKPANVLVGAGDRVTLTDFGIAIIEGDTTITQAGQFVGSAGYLAPERVAGEPVGAASDLWSLGATLFMAVEGRGPYDRDAGSMAMLGAILTQDAPMAPHAGPLAPVISGLLVREPERRLSAEEVAERLDAIATGGVPPAAEPPGTKLANLLAGVEPVDAPRPPDEPPGPYGPPGYNGARTDGPPGPPPTGPPGRPPSGPPGPPAPGPYAPYGQGAWPGTGPRPAPRRSRTPLVLGVIAACVVLVIVLAVLVLHILRRPVDSGARSARPSTGRPAPSTGGNPNTRRPAIPAGYTRHVDPAGFSVALPERWGDRTASGNSVTYFNPGHTAYLLVDRTPQPTSDPMTNMQQFIRDAHRDGKYRGSTTLNLHRRQYLNAPAAVWEFRWTLDTGVPAHAEDRQVVLPGGKYLAVYWQTTESAWSAPTARLARTTAFSSLRIN